MTRPDSSILSQEHWEGATLLQTERFEVTKGRPSMHTLTRKLHKWGKTKLDVAHSYTTRTLALPIPPTRSSEGYVSPGFSVPLLLFGLGQGQFPLLCIASPWCKGNAMDTHDIINKG